MGDIKEKMVKYYMDVACLTSQLSYAKKLKVGAILVKEDKIISHSWNGTPRGWDNVCEDKIYMSPDVGGLLDVEQIENQWPYVEYSETEPNKALRYTLKTKQYVTHAEEAMLMKIASSNESSEGSSLFCTHSCCINCAKLIYGAKIKDFYYSEEYRSSQGIEFLLDFGINVIKLEKRNGFGI